MQHLLNAFYMITGLSQCLLPDMEMLKKNAPYNIRHKKCQHIAKKFHFQNSANDRMHHFNVSVAVKCCRDNDCRCIFAEKCHMDKVNLMAFTFSSAMFSIYVERYRPCDRDSHSLYYRYSFSNTSNHGSGVIVCNSVSVRCDNMLCIPKLFMHLWICTLSFLKVAIILSNFFCLYGNLNLSLSKGLYCRDPPDIRKACNHIFYHSYWFLVNDTVLWYLLEKILSVSLFDQSKTESC